MRTVWIGALMLGAACSNTPQRGEEGSASAGSLDRAEAAAAPQDQLEAIFWHCDYVATTKGMDATPVRECAAATRQLRRVKFEGSFNRMLEWWRQNKPAEHARIRRMRNEPPQS